MTLDVKSNEKEAKKEDAVDRRRGKDTPCSKVVIRCLPPTLTEAEFLEDIAPLPDNNYLYYVRADRSLELNAFCRAYINFTNSEDILPFRDQWDGHLFSDSKGVQYPAVVEFAPYQKVPKKQGRKADPRSATIEEDEDFKQFAESLQAEVERLPSAETYLEELEAKLSEREARDMTPLLAFIKNKKMERIKLRQEAREERRRKEREQKKRDEERRQKREEERRRQREKPRQREREAKERDKAKDKKSHAEDTQKIKLLKKPENETGSHKGDADEKSREKDKTVRKEQTRLDDRKERDAKSARQYRDQPPSGTRDRDNRERGGLKDHDRSQRERDKEQARKAERDRYRDRDRDRQPARGTDRPNDRDRDKHPGPKEKGRDGETRAVQEKRPGKDAGSYSSSSKGPQASREEKRGEGARPDSHNEKPRRPDVERTTKEEAPSSIGAKRSEREGHPRAWTRRDDRHASAAEKRPPSGRRSSDLGTDSSEGSTDKPAKSARGKDGNERLRNKDRPTMALYQPGQRSSRGQDTKAGSEKPAGGRSSAKETKTSPSSSSQQDRPDRLKGAGKEELTNEGRAVKAQPRGDQRRGEQPSTTSQSHDERNKSRATRPAPDPKQARRDERPRREDRPAREGDRPARDRPATQARDANGKRRGNEPSRGAGQTDRPQGQAAQDRDRASDKSRSGDFTRDKKSDKPYERSADKGKADKPRDKDNRKPEGKDDSVK